MTERGRRRPHLAVQLPEPGASDFAAVVSLVQAAERAVFDFVLADGDFTVLAALAAVTERIGLVCSVDTDSAQPFEAARQLATLDHLCDGRAGWQLTGTDQRRIEEFAAVADALWGSWEPDAVVADAAAGVYVRPDRIRAVEHRGAQFDVRGVATVPAGPQGRPVRVQSGGCDGFVVIPCSEHGLDDLVGRVVPMLQDRGWLAREYGGRTLRQHLGVQAPQQC